MPVQLRSANGQVTPIGATHAIEVLDASGNLGLVVVQSPGGAINILTPGDPQFLAHANVTRQKVSKVVIHEPKPPKPGSSIIL